MHKSTFSHISSHTRMASAMPILLALLINSCSVPLKRGDVVPRYPNGLIETSGQCIGGEASSEVCAFSIAVLSKTHSLPVFAVSKKLISRDESGKPLWQIEDVVSLPKNIQSMSIEGGVCRHLNIGDNTIIALVPKYDQNSPEYIRAQRWAYRVELPNAKFVTIDPSNVLCGNTAIGSD